MGGAAKRGKSFLVFLQISLDRSPIEIRAPGDFFNRTVSLVQ
jgi:hypothetical protein